MGRQRAENLLRDLSKEREGKKALSNRSLKTDGETESGDPSKGSLERDRGEESRDLSNRSLKTGGETKSGEPTQG